jgi:peptidoglycan hydrolase FlgJ
MASLANLAASSTLRPRESGAPGQHMKNLSNWLLDSRLRGNERSLLLDSSEASSSGAPAAPKGTLSEELRNKARASAVDFEATFLNAMFSQMFTGIDGDGPFGGGGAGGVWRSFLSDEYAKTFAKAGGIGLADHVYRALIAQQEGRQA